jgi:hypothetical protein
MSRYKDDVVVSLLSIFFIGFVFGTSNTVIVNERVVGDLHYYEFYEIDQDAKDEPSPTEKEDPIERVPLYAKSSQRYLNYSETAIIYSIFFALFICLIFLVSCFFSIFKKTIDTCYRNVIRARFKNDDDSDDEECITRSVISWQL